MKLNDPIIKSSKPKEKPYKLTDGNSLILLVNPNGSKWWRYRYVFGGKEKMLSFGKYPNISLKKARELRDEARELLDQGYDPSRHRQEEKLIRDLAVRNTFEAVARDWWENWHTDKSDRHAKATIRSLEHNLFPVIGNRPISQISAQELIGALKPIESKSSDTARRLLDVSRMIFRRAVAHAQAQRNPASDFNFSDIFKARSKTNYARISEKELPELLGKIDAYQGNPITKLALQFMLLVFVRTRELTSARWEEVDFDKKLWRIPSERMKMRCPHVVPLSRQSIEILKQIKELTGSGQYIFPGEKDPKKPMHFNTMLYALYDLGYQSKMTTHGFRGLAATILREKQYPSEHVELQLAHLIGNATQRAYDWSNHLPERAQMMQAWADFLDGQKNNHCNTF